MFYLSCFLFFFNDTATTEIYTLSLHDALPIYHLDAHPDEHQCQSGLQVDEAVDEVGEQEVHRPQPQDGEGVGGEDEERLVGDRKSTRLNSSHANISYAVFCLKKKKKQKVDYNE